MESLMIEPADRAIAAGVRALQAGVDGAVVTEHDAGYEDARRVWNAMIDRRPAAIARCATVADVQRCVAFARDRGLPLSVRGGGHNIAGLALCDGGLTIDLSAMKRIVVDPATATAVAEPGLTWGEFDRETQRFGLATTGGAVSTTGIAGLTLGGGLGWLMSRFGFTVDNLVSADVVLADSRLVTASADRLPDLFWALRGGGGNFGVVTSFTYRLHQVGAVLSGMIGHRLEDFAALLAFHQEMIVRAPDELTVHLALLTLPTGQKACAVVPFWSGDLAEGERRLAPWRAFGAPLFDGVTAMPYTAAQAMLDAAAPYGRRNYWKSSFLTGLPADAASAIAERFAQATSPFSLCLIEHVHGAAARVPADATAFSVRGDRLHFIAGAAWEPDGADAPHVQWARELWAVVQPWSARRVYGNILAADESDRVAEAYGPSRRRLSRVKSAFDPDNLFRVNHNIVPERSLDGARATGEPIEARGSDHS
jgi:FAD/FMN-containing dehydrogenase